MEMKIAIDLSVIPDNPHFESTIASILQDLAQRLRSDHVMEGDRWELVDQHQWKFGECQFGER